MKNITLLHVPEDKKENLTNLLVEHDITPRFANTAAEMYATMVEFCAYKVLDYESPDFMNELLRTF